LLIKGEIRTALPAAGGPHALSPLAVVGLGLTTLVGMPVGYTERERIQKRCANGSWDVYRVVLTRSVSRV